MVVGHSTIEITGKISNNESRLSGRDFIIYVSQKGDDLLKGGAMSGAASGLGYGVGKVAQGQLDKFLNPMKPWKDWIWLDVGMGISKPLPVNPVPGIAGNASGSAATEILNDQLGKTVNSNGKKQ